MAKKLNININDENTIEKLHQEAYNDAVNLISEATYFISALQNSTELKDAIIEEKTKYMKAMTDLMKMKDNAIKTKVSITQGIQNYQKNSIKKTEETDESSSFSPEDFASAMKLIKKDTEVPESQKYTTKK